VPVDPGLSLSRAASAACRRVGRPARQRRPRSNTQFATSPATVAPASREAADDSPPVIGKRRLGPGGRRRRIGDASRGTTSSCAPYSSNVRHVELWRRIERRIHQIDQAVDRRDPRPLDDHRVLGQRPQHRQIVGRLMPRPRPVSVNREKTAPREQRDLGQSSIVARPHTPGAEDQARRPRPSAPRRPGRGEDRDGAPHALAE